MVNEILRPGSVARRAEQLGQVAVRARGVPGGRVGLERLPGKHQHRDGLLWRAPQQRSAAVASLGRVAETAGEAEGGPADKIALVRPVGGRIKAVVTRIHRRLRHGEGPVGADQP
jgi:hypothetical protein